MSARLESWLTKRFGQPEQINGANRCPTYLWRWFIADRPNWKVYLHKFTGSDWSRDLHDHPKRWSNELIMTDGGFNDIIAYRVVTP